MKTSFRPATVGNLIVGRSLWSWGLVELQRSVRRAEYFSAPVWVEAGRLMGRAHGGIKVPTGSKMPSVAARPHGVSVGRLQINCFLGIAWT